MTLMNTDNLERLIDIDLRIGVPIDDLISIVTRKAINYSMRRGSHTPMMNDYSRAVSVVEGYATRKWGYRK